MKKRASAVVLLAFALASCSLFDGARGVSPQPLRSTIAASPEALGYRAGDLVFAVKGDWGAGTPAQRRVTRAMCALRATVPFTDVLTVGDNFYDPDGVATQRNFLTPEKCLIDAGIRWRAVWGNHDWNHSSTRAALGTPSHWYTWTKGGAQFFALDSNQTDDAAQRGWLESELRASTAKVKIVYFHHPPYTAGSVHPPDKGVRARWVPLFEQYGVTLVLNGHEHDYEHHIVNGIDYVVSGGGGALLYGCAHKVANMVQCIESFEFLAVIVRGTAVTVTAVDDGGHVIDSFAV
jgi:hypothetical protein